MAEYDGKFQHLKVGQGVTLCYPQDRYGYVVVKATAKRATVVALATPDASKGDEPARFDGPFPVWDKTYSEEELSAALAAYQAVGSRYPARTIAMHKDGRWWMGGDSPVAIWGANYYRNYSF